MRGRALLAAAGLVLSVAGCAEPSESSPKASSADQPMPEAPSTVNATYVAASATRELAPGEKLANLYTLNRTSPYLLQRLTKRVYWFQSQYYGTVFHVGEQGVLLFDPLEGRGEFLRQAIAQVTRLPVTAIVYSHNHADHMGDARGFVEAATQGGIRLRIIASKATADKQVFLQSSHPRATETVEWPRGSFQFEDLTVQLHGFDRASHADDHGVWLLVQEKVAHLPDLVNPDQPPFWTFAGSENFVYYESNVRQLGSLDWVFLNGGHGNVGSKADIEFILSFLADLKKAVGKAMQESPWGEGIDPARVNAHTVFLSSWVATVARKATDALRPKYGEFYGFEVATPANAQMVAMAMFSYR